MLVVDLVRSALSPFKNSQSWHSISRGFNTHLSKSKWNTGTGLPPEPDNPLRKYFDSHQSGPGIWKWLHYFDIYHEHFQAFRGREVHIVEIGIYSGGSLDMWRDYFGAKARIYGVDIEPSCRVYEEKGYEVFIGDQGDRSFWQDFRRKVPIVDIVIDDGGHLPEQQIVTLEELLPHIRPGGVFLCEDVHNEFNHYMFYINGLSQRLNAWNGMTENDDPERRIVINPNKLQAELQSVHLYPYVTVLRKNRTRLTELRAAKHGTEWQPFLK
jgi:hypothetical protein